MIGRRQSHRSLPAVTLAGVNRPIRTTRTALLAVLVLPALALVAAKIGCSYAERAIRARLEREASRCGWIAHFDAVRVGVFPPLRITGLRAERRGGWSVAADAVEVTLRPWGSGLVGRTRLRLGHVTLVAPASLSLEGAPALWDIEAAPANGLRAELREPVQGLAVTWLPAAGGDSIELRGTDVPVGRLLVIRRDGAPLLDGGAVTGKVHILSASGSTTFDVDAVSRSARVAALSDDIGAPAGELPAFGEATDVALRLEGSWRPAEGALEVPHVRLAIDGATLSGSLALADVARDPRVDLSIDVERVDFARLLRTSGLGRPEAVASATDGVAHEGDLGSASLSARAKGRTADPASFVVSQRLDFTPPRHPPPALERLRGDFVHEFVLAGGRRKAIAVSAASPDFIALQEVPPLFVRTLLLGEDAAFFGHQGIDLSGVPSALVSNWMRGRVLRGASTITQQLAKNLFLSREKRLGRKLQELSLALLLEATLGKERILEIYLNVIEWGPGLYGLRPAARHYFDREPGELTPKQMAFLVALIPGPLKYQRSFAKGTPSPGFRPLIDELLAKLHSIDALSEEQYETARAEELFVARTPAEAGREGEEGAP